MKQRNLMKQRILRKNLKLPPIGDKKTHLWVEILFVLNRENNYIKAHQLRDTLETRIENYDLKKVSFLRQMRLMEEKQLIVSDSSQTINEVNQFKEKLVKISDIGREALKEAQDFYRGLDDEY